tara:strand:+ start:336 stop:512 length:177 start_codon:yes stop_codon:yes gene_type:complete
MDNKERNRARAEGKLARAKGGHARRLARKLGLDAAAPAPVEAPTPPKKKKATRKKKAE